MPDEERPGAESPLDERFRPEHSTRTWRACCVAPIMATVILLVLAVTASLYDRRTPGPSPSPSPSEANNARREDFIRFGKQYFAIAERADKVNERAFAEIERMAQGESSIEAVHEAFSAAAQANGQAAREYKELEIPDSLTSRSKISQSLDIISQAYDHRRRACEIVVGWNGDPQDSETAERYRVEAETVNRLTREALQHLGEAATANGVTREDVQRFVPSAADLLDSQLGKGKTPGAHR